MLRPLYQLRWLLSSYYGFSQLLHLVSCPQMLPVKKILIGKSLSKELGYTMLESLILRSELSFNITYTEKQVDRTK